MTPLQFRDAVRKGLGRAILHLKDAEPAPYRWVITRAILRYPGYDAQCEGSRSLYLAELAEGAGCLESATAVAIRALPLARTSRTAEHLLGFVTLAARRGDTSARAAVREALFRGHPDVEFFAATEWVEVEGVQGLIDFASRLGAELHPDNACHFAFVKEEAERSLGLKVVEDALAREARDNPAVARFAELCRTSSEWGPIPRPASDVAGLTFAQIDSLIKGAEGRHSGNRFVALWLKQASEEQRQELAEAFESEYGGAILRAYALGLSRMPYPKPLDRLIDLMRIAEPVELHWRTLAVKRTQDPALRELALDLLGEEGRWQFGCELLRINAIPGDEGRILEVLRKHEKTGDREVLHSAVMDVTDLAEQQKHLGTGPLLLWVWENSPCALCRESAVRQLIERGEAPRYMLEEALWDCQEETREMARQALG